VFAGEQPDIFFLENQEVVIMEEVSCFENYARYEIQNPAAVADNDRDVSAWQDEADPDGKEDDGVADTSLAADSYDPMKMYLNEIGFTRLLKRNEELAVAMRIQAGRERAIKALFSFPYAVKKLLASAGMVRRGDLSLDDLVRPADNREEFFALIKQIERLHRRRSASPSLVTGTRKKTAAASTTRTGKGNPQDLNLNKLLDKIISLGLKFDVVSKFFHEIDENVQRTAQEAKKTKNHRGYARGMKDFESSLGLPYDRAESLLREYADAQKEIDTAKKVLIEANLRLVVSSARRYAGIGSLSMSDLIQEGNIGLMRAAELFDFRMGYKFSTYAMCWIKQAITRALSNSSRMIRLPVHTTYQVSKIIRTSRDLVQECGDEPTPETIAARLKMPPKRVLNLLGMSNEPLSLSMAIGEDNTPLSDYIEDKTVPSALEIVIKDDLKVKISKALGILQPKEKRIVAVRFGIGEEEQTLETLAQEFGVTRERIRQIETSAIKKLKVSLAELGV
jgi:RNA polymerase primary sigma factor